MNEMLLKARNMLHEGGYACVVCGRDTVAVSEKRGVMPLLQWLAEGKNWQGCAAADRVVGRAAAFLYVRLGVTAVYADVISRGGAEVLAGRGIETAWGEQVPFIANRSGDGLCPMEEAVLSLDDPEAAEEALRRKAAALAQAGGMARPR